MPSLSPSSLSSLSGTLPPSWPVSLPAAGIVPGSPTDVSVIQPTNPFGIAGPKMPAVSTTTQWTQVFNSTYAIGQLPVTPPSNAIPASKFDVHPEWTPSTYMYKVCTATGGTPASTIITDNGTNRYMYYLLAASLGNNPAPTGFTRVLGAPLSTVLVVGIVAAVAAIIAILTVIFTRPNGAMKKRPKSMSWY